MAHWAGVFCIQQLGTVKPGKVGVSPKVRAPELALRARCPDSRPAASPTNHTAPLSWSVAGWPGVER